MENESPGQLVNLLEVQNKQLVALWRTLCILLYSVCAVGNCCLSLCLNVGRLWEGCEKRFANPGKSRTFLSLKLWEPCNRLLALRSEMSWSRNQRPVIRTKKCSLSHVSKSLVLVLGLVLGLLCSEVCSWSPWCGTFHFCFELQSSPSKFIQVMHLLKIVLLAAKDMTTMRLCTGIVSFGIDHSLEFLIAVLVSRFWSFLSSLLLF